MDGGFGRVRYLEAKLQTIVFYPAHATNVINQQNPHGNKCFVLIVVDIFHGINNYRPID